MRSEITAMKRKRSLDDPALLSPRKKAEQANSSVVSKKAVMPGLAPALGSTGPSRVGSAKIAARKACLLIQVLRQYGLQESVVSSLRPKDLLALALSCKATFSALFPRPESLDNLLGRMPCCGTGIEMRKRMHTKSTFYYAYQCTEYAQCRTASGRQIIEERPCVSCKVTTCDECRIHCVYQSIYETPEGPDDLPNFSGFVLLDPLECAILSPHHLSTEDVSSPRWQNRASDAAAGPYHDQGFLDMPLEIDQPGTPEKISDVLDVDLGLVSLTTWSGNSQFGFPSPVLRSLCKVTEERKLCLCDCSFDDARKCYNKLKPNFLNATQEAFKKCHCSLRSHILNRWQCVSCYRNEDAVIKQLNAYEWSCRCGQDAQKVICLWCWGEVLEEKHVDELSADRGQIAEEE